MKRSTLAVILLSMCSLSAFAGTNTDRVRPSYSMPEPGGIAELATCVVGLGMYAWRRHKLSN